MLGNNSRFFASLKQEILHLQGTHCFLHQHALASKTLLPKLKNVLDTFVKTINLIRGRALNHRLFKSLCQDFGSEHLALLFHADVHWLSCERDLMCFFQWREEVKALLKECDYNLSREMESQEFNQMLAYLSNVFSCFYVMEKYRHIKMPLKSQMVSKKSYISAVDELKEVIFQIFPHL